MRPLTRILWGPGALLVRAGFWALAGLALVASGVVSLAQGESAGVVGVIFGALLLMMGGLLFWIRPQLLRARAAKALEDGDAAAVQGNLGESWDGPDPR